MNRVTVYFGPFCFINLTKEQLGVSFDEGKGMVEGTISDPRRNSFVQAHANALANVLNEMTPMGRA